MESPAPADTVPAYTVPADTVPVYTVHPTPIGPALVVMRDGLLVALSVLDGSPRHALADIGAHLRAVPVEDAETTAGVAAQLDEYFAGRRRAFDVPIDWGFAAGFARAALQVVCDIPYGETASYGEVALHAGSPRAHRAVGTACAMTPVSIVLPAHRVVRSDGSIGEYGGHPERKRFLLDLEARHSPA